MANLPEIVFRRFHLHLNLAVSFFPVLFGWLIECTLHMNAVMYDLTMIVCENEVFIWKKRKGGGVVCLVRYSTKDMYGLRNCKAGQVVKNNCWLGLTELRAVRLVLTCYYFWWLALLCNYWIECQCRRVHKSGFFVFFVEQEFMSFWTSLIAWPIKMCHNGKSFLHLDYIRWFCIH